MGWGKFIREGMNSVSGKEINISSPIYKWEVKEKYDTVIFNGYEPPPKYDIILGLWGSEFAEIFNPVGSLLNYEDATAKVKHNGVSATEIVGSKSRIKIREGIRPNEGFVLDFQNLFKNKDINIAGTIIQNQQIHFSIRKKNKPTITDNIKANIDIFHNRPPEYIQFHKLEGTTLNKFIIFTEQQEYFAVDYLGNINFPIKENNTLTITKGTLNIEDRVIIAEKLLINGTDVTKEHKLKFEEKYFSKKTIIEGKIADLKVSNVNSEDYKEWLWKQSKMFDKDLFIESFKEFYNQYALTNFTKEFLLPLYTIKLRTDDKKDEYITIRPVWFLKESKMYDLIPLSQFCEDDKIICEISKNESGFPIVHSIYNKNTHSFIYSTVDLNEEEYINKYDILSSASFSQNGSIYQVVSIRGQIITEPETYLFGFNPEEVRYILNLFMDLETKMTQVIFRLKTDDGSEISCRATINLLKRGTNNKFDFLNPVQKISNMSVKLKGYILTNGVFNISEIKHL